MEEASVARVAQGRAAEAAAAAVEVAEAAAAEPPVVARVGAARLAAAMTVE